MTAHNSLFRCGINGAFTSEADSGGSLEHNKNCGLILARERAVLFPCSTVGFYFHSNFGLYTAEKSLISSFLNDAKVFFTRAARNRADTSLFYSPVLLLYPICHLQTSNSSSREEETEETKGKWRRSREETLKRGKGV